MATDICNSVFAVVLAIPLFVTFINVTSIVRKNTRLLKSVRVWRLLSNVKSHVRGSEKKVVPSVSREDSARASNGVSVLK